MKIPSIQKSPKIHQNSPPWPEKEKNNDDDSTFFPSQIFSRILGFGNGDKSRGVSDTQILKSAAVQSVLQSTKKGAKNWSPAV